jgi:WD40 repeat protein
MVASVIHSELATSVAFSHDSSRIASGSEDKTIIWDAKTGVHLATLKDDSRWVASVALLPDGSSIASGSMDENIRIWDATTVVHPTVIEGHAASVDSVAFSPEGSRIASGSYSKYHCTVQIWDAHTGVYIEGTTIFILLG